MGYGAYQGYRHNQLESFARELLQNPQCDQDALASSLGLDLDNLTDSERKFVKYKMREYAKKYGIKIWFY